VTLKLSVAGPVEADCRGTVLMVPRSYDTASTPQLIEPVPLVPYTCNDGVQVEPGLLTGKLTSHAGALAHELITLPQSSEKQDELEKF
jgi:hypothetical protein